MKKYTVVFLALLLIGAVSCSKPISFEVGQTVAAQWKDGNWYLATIKSVSGDRYDVLYADGDKGSVTRDELQTVPEKLRLRVGDKVLAVWSTAKFYPGTVKEVKNNGAVIKWDDGSTPSLVEYGKILKM